MESHSRIKGRLDGNAHIWGASVSSRCARAALTVQAHGTPLAHKSRLDGNAHIWGASVSSRCARAALTVQAHGAPLAHKSRLDGNTYGVQVSLVVARERRLRCRRMERHSRIKVDMTGTPTYGVQVSLVVARERRLLCRRMESHSRIKVRLDGNAHIWGASVSSRCARAALTVQAYGEPLSHKSKT